MPKEKDSVLLVEKDEVVEAPDYSDSEEIYIKNLQKRLTEAKDQRDAPHEEFDGMSLSQYYEENERRANTMIKPAKNRGDVTFESGTLRNKMMAFLASYQGLNLQPDIIAYGGKSQIPLTITGNAMEDIVEKTEEMENEGGDEELKMLRQYEMLKQGTVFLEELWDEGWKVEKEITQDFSGNIKQAKWTTDRKKGQGQPKRKILSLLSVYLGDMRQYFIENQPYIFTVEVINYSEAEKIYGNKVNGKDIWERWQYVSKDKKEFSGTIGNEMVDNVWRLTSDIEKNKVEVIKYQDKPNQEFQIILNGVVMLPMGYPFPWGHREYSIVQQNLEPIRFDFAMGKSFIFKNKNLVALLDEMMRLAVLKTQKSFMPPSINTSGRIVSKRIFMPGQITMGLQPGQILPLSEQQAQGVTTSEFNMIQEVIANVDRNTASQTFTGQREAGAKPTATQILELQRQARIMMGILILAATLLEKKLTMKRIMILLDKWFSPLDTVLDEARNALKDRYRIVSRARGVRDQGQGVRMTVMAKEAPTSEEIKEKENQMEETFGKPFEIVVLNPNEIQSARLTWMVNVVPKEKKSSESSKMLFSAMMLDAMNLGLRLDPDFIEQTFAEVWEYDPNKLFVKEGEKEPLIAPEGATERGGATPRPPTGRKITPPRATPTGIMG